MHFINGKESSALIEQDTIKLLRECDAGIKMGTESIDEVMDYVHAPQMRDLLNSSRYEHTRLGTEIQTQLDRFQDKGKNPNPVAQKMSWMKTNMKLVMDESDATIADLMTDGCNMGVKSLNRYLNQYKAADERSKDLTKRLIGLEEQLTVDLRSYL